MTPHSIRDKGEELIATFSTVNDAIKAVGEIIDQIKNLCKPKYTSFFHGEMGSGTTLDGYELKDYWNQILQYLKEKV